MSISAISLSGLQASSQRIETSAINIANSQSTDTKGNTTTLNDENRQAEPFAPQELITFPVEASNGVQTIRQDRNSPYINVYAPLNPDADSNGIVRIPNIDYPSEIKEAMMATYAFDGNLQVIQTAKDMIEDFLNIVA